MLNRFQIIECRYWFILLISFSIAVSAQFPVAEKIKKELILHDNKRLDNYYWLRNSKDPKVKAYLEYENKFLENYMEPSKTLQTKLVEELKSRGDKTEISVPYFYNGYYYYKRSEQNNQYPIYLRSTNADNNNEEILLNTNELAKGHKHFQISNFGMKISPDNKTLALGIDSTGEGSFITIFKDLRSGKWLSESISNTIGDVTWSNDSKSVFYSCLDNDFRASKVKKHIIGESVLKDKQVYYEKDQSFDIYLYKSKSNKFVFLRTSNGTSSEFRFLNADKPASNFKLFQVRQKNVDYTIYHSSNKFYVLTNYNAPNFRVMEVSDSIPTRDKWKEVIPMNTNGRIFELEVFKNHIAVHQLTEGNEELRVFDLKDFSNHIVKFDEEVYSIFLSSGPLSNNHEYNSEKVRFSYSSLTTPDCLFEYDMSIKKKVSLKQKDISGFNSSDFESKRIYVSAKDGSKIPLSLVYKKGVVLNGENPLLLNGYGAYGGYDPTRFSETRISLLNRGFIYAIAHIRGGEEMGSQWYEQGRQLTKTNTFTDFISCAEYLIQNKYSNPQKMFAQGQSAGGLIMGYVANNRPELFKGIIADVPLLDLVTMMLGDSYDFVEWGDPKIKKHYDYMLSYSPYDNIKKQNYPAMLISVGFYDQYWDGAKWVAKTRELNTGTNPILLSTDFNSAHEGPSGKLEVYKKIAQKYAFIMSLCGISD